MLTVNSVLDTDSADVALTLREAISIVNAGNTTGRSAQELAQVSGSLGSNDTIQFNSALSGQSITMTGSRFNLTKNVKIQGPGAKNLKIDGNNGRQIFFVDGRTNGSISVTVQGLELRHGRANGTGGTNTGGLDNSIRGGAIFNDSGNLTVLECYLLLNGASFGGAIYNFSGTTTVQNSTVSNNAAGANGGGVTNNAGTLSITQSTISFNSSSQYTGGLVNAGNGAMIVTQSTIVENQASNLVGANSHGAGIYTNSGSNTVLNNTVVAGNIVVNDPDFGASDIGGDTGVTVSGTFNYIASTTSGGLSNGVNGNIVQNTLFSTLLTGLGEFGGPTPTHLPKPDSPLLDAGSNANVAAAITTDQRGAARIVDSPDAGTTATVDIGAVEGTDPIGPYIVTSAGDEDDTDYSSGDFTLREAIRLANANPAADTILFAPNITTVTLTIGQLSLSDSARTTIDGGVSGVTIQRSSASGTPNFRIFDVAFGPGTPKADFVHLTITAGNLPGGDGGGIKTQDADVHITASTIAGNSANNGGGVFNAGGTMTITNSTLSGNSANGNGGGVINDFGAVTITNSTIANNRADADGAGGGIGGGLWTSIGGLVAVTTIKNTIVAGNFIGTGSTANDIANKNVEVASTNNLIGDAGSAGGLTNGANGNKVGVNPQLGPLADNGGPTKTHALGATSPAREAGSNANIPAGVTTDQRGAGFPRINGTAVDIGAFESPTPDTSPPTVTNIDDGDLDNVVQAGDVVTYTITFNEAIDGSTVTAADFDNAASSTFTIGAINHPSANVFTVQVTPTNLGLFKFRIKSGAIIKDVAGNNLAVPVADDETLIVQGPDTSTANPIWKTYTPSQAFTLHSLPGATKVIYMDFDGEAVSGTSWNTDFNNGNPFTVPAWSMDGDRSTFSDAERNKIIEMWRTVAEDFAPFNIDVTTQNPGLAGILFSGGSDDRWGAHGIIGADPRTVVSNSPQQFPTGIGVASDPSFKSSFFDPFFVWGGDSVPNPEALLPDTVSHEAGHTLGLQHDGIGNGVGNNEYYGGHGSGVTSWGPIMGDPVNRAITQWSRAIYTGANNNQDDLAIIAGTANGAGYRTDDHGDTLAAASTVPSDGTPVYGIIGKASDLDLFSFQADVGHITIQVDPLAIGANLDIRARLLDANGASLAVSGLTTTLSATLNFDNMLAGRFYLEIDGVGIDPAASNYPDYGSLGNYRVQAIFTKAPTHVAVEPIFGINSLVFNDLAGNTANNLTVKMNATQTAVEITDSSTILTSNVGAISNAGHTVSVPLTAFPGGRIQTNTQGGNDTVTLDWTNGYVEPSGTAPIFINAGTGSDKLKIVGDNAAYIRVITGLITTQATSSSIRRVPAGGTARQHFLSNLEDIEVSNMGTLDFLTRNKDDEVTYSPVDAVKSKITGNSGTNAVTQNPQPFIPVTWSTTPTLYLYTSNGDTAASTNSAIIKPNALKTPGLKNFIYSGGAGFDYMEVQSAADLNLPVAGGQVLFNGNARTDDTLVVIGNTNFTLNNFRLTPASGGFVRPVNVERVVIIGGGSANTINAAGFTGTAIIDGRGGNDIITGGSGRNILIGHIGADTITGGGNDDILIGGALNFAANSPEMAAIVDEWTSAGSYSTRVNNLRTGGGLAGGTKITTVTAPDDGAIDTLKGNAGLDWFFAYGTDVLVDKLATELLR